MVDGWLTTLSAIKKRDPDWAVIAVYEAPVRRHLERRWPQLALAERDDLVQEVLLAMREKLVPGYDAGVGRFRALLVTAIGNRVRDRLRRRKAAPLSDVELDATCAPTAEEAAAIDLEAIVVRAVEAVHDRHVRGGDPELVWVLSGVLVDGLSNQEVARREGLSVDQVKRALQQARSELLTAILSDLLPGATPTRIAAAAELARLALREPRRGTRALADADDAAAREAVEGLVGAVRARSAAPGPAGATPDLLARIGAVFTPEPGA
jgi:RNA polymerase sigma factor (sigma-70 family)